MTTKLTPYALLRNLYGKSEDWRPQWADHVSVVRTRNGLVYIAEPYQLYPEAFNDFAVIEAHGWRVEVDGQSTHNPGHTLRVCMTPTPAAALRSTQATFTAPIHEESEHMTTDHDPYDVEAHEVPC